MIGRFLAVAILMSAVSTRADLVATVDRTIVSDADLLTLTVRASDKTADTEPDFSVLERDFEVVSLRPQRNNSFTIINGKTSRVSYVDYVIRLAPKRLGELNIPAIRAGREVTRAIPIRVQTLSARQRQQLNQFVFFETSVDTNEIYVQSQIVYSVKLFYTESIGGDFPQPPNLPDTVVETLENEKRYESIVGGKRYYVLEKRYALFPQRSGDLVIPRERFHGSRGRGGIFSQKQTVSAVSESHTVRVKTIPSAFNGDHWVPARNLTVSETWGDSTPVFRVGEPVSRTITLAAAGLSTTSLPRLVESDVTNAKIYADPPVTENRVAEDGIHATQVTTIGIVPTEAGELHLPEVRIPWWNTITDREEVAIVPAATFTVLPSQNTAADIPTVTVPVSELTQPGATQEIASPYWQWAAIALGLLWAMTLVQLLMLRRRLRVLESAALTQFETVSFDAPDEAREYKSLNKACSRNNAADSHRQLFLWAKARYPEISSVSQLGTRFPDLALEIETLEMHLFSKNEGGSWRGAALLAAVEQLRNARQAKPVNRTLTSSLNPA